MQDAESHGQKNYLEAESQGAQATCPVSMSNAGGFFCLLFLLGPFCVYPTWDPKWDFVPCIIAGGVDGPCHGCNMFI